MLGIIVFLVALLAMFGWFIYLFAKDPANLFKRSERAQRRREFGQDRRADDGSVTPIDAGRAERNSGEGAAEGGGKFGGAGSSGEWSGKASGTDGGDGSSSSDGGGSSGD